MAITLTIKQFIVIFISMFVLILGALFLIKTTKITEVLPLLPLPFPGEKIIVKVEPLRSQQGTVFLINAIEYRKREQQDLILKIENENYSKTIYLYDDGKHFDEKPNDSIYGGFFDSANSPLGEYKIKNEEETLASFETYKSKCEMIIGNKVEEKINFVILPQNYNNYKEFKEDALKILQSKNSLLNIEPFKSDKDKFSFSLIDTNINLGCNVGCYNVSAIICCNNKLVLEEASQCSYDSIIVLVNNDNLCGSASSYAKICSKNKLSNLGLVHELGHSFGDLADEYVYEGYNVGGINNVNCDKEGCGKWESITDGCFKGCTYSNLYRSAETSIMHDYVSFFNLVSENYIKSLIEDYIKKEKETEKSLPNKKSYFVNLNYNNGKINIENIYLKPIKSGIELKKSDYSAELKDAGGKTIFKTNLYLPIKIFPLPNSSAQPIMLDKVDFSAILPYSSDAETLQIYKNNKKIAETSLAIFSDKCGDKICDKTENHLICDIDCEIDKDNFCETSKCDPDCTSQKNCLKNKKIVYSVSILIVLILFVIIVFILYKVRKK